MAYVQREQDANRQIRLVTNVSIITNLMLSGLKIFVGLRGRSMALIVDGVHSISDMATDIIVLMGVRFGSKEADPEHPYGHGRIETFAAAGIAVILMFVGGGMIYRTALAITDYRPVKSGFSVLVVAAVSIITKELLYRISKKVAITSHSSALYANAWHHRSDALSSVVVVVGVVSITSGFKYGDHIAAMVVGAMIILVAGQIIVGCLQELTEGSVDKDTIRQITAVIDANSSIRQWHKLRSRTVGREVFLDLHILVEPDLNIAAAHEISERLEEALHRQMTRPVNITVHIEPDVPELRK